MCVHLMSAAAAARATSAVVGGEVRMCRVGQNRVYTPYMTVCIVISLPKYRIYIVYTYMCMVLAIPTYVFVSVWCGEEGRGGEGRAERV